LLSGQYALSPAATAYMFQRVFEYKTSLRT
jgi:hypothetical protein